MIIKDKPPFPKENNMDVSYVYCNHCGYEDTEVFVAYSRTCASGDLWICPKCGDRMRAQETGEYR